MINRSRVPCRTSVWSLTVLPASRRDELDRNRIADDRNGERAIRYFGLLKPSNVSTEYLR